MDRWLARLHAALAARWVEYLALCGLAAVFVYSGVDKLLHFSAAAREFASVGLQPAAPLVAATIVSQLGGSLLLFTHRFKAIGALLLAGFTAAATLVAHRFWEMPPTRYVPELNAFLEHLGLIGGFLLVALIAARRPLR